MPRTSERRWVFTGIREEPLGRGGVSLQYTMAEVGPHPLTPPREQYEATHVHAGPFFDRRRKRARLRLARLARQMCAERNAAHE